MIDRHQEEFGMSKAGYPYANAPMERYFNTLKNECTNLYEFREEPDLIQNPL